MDQNVKQQPFSQEWNLLPLTPPNEQQTNVAKGIIDMAASQPVSLSSWNSTTSVDSRTTQERATDELFDKIEDLISEYLRDPQRHHFDYRVIRCSLGGDPQRLFHAVVVINPPS